MTWLSALKALLVSLPEIIKGIRSIADMFAGWKKAAAIAKREKRIATTKQLTRKLLNTKDREKRAALVKKLNSL